VFREAVRVPRHAFSPNVTGALGTPLDFLFKLGLRFYLEDLFLERDEREVPRPKRYYCGLGFFATFLETNASPGVSICYEHDFGALARGCDVVTIRYAGSAATGIVEKLYSHKRGRGYQWNFRISFGPQRGPAA